MQVKERAKHERQSSEREQQVVRDELTRKQRELAETQQQMQRKVNCIVHMPCLETSPECRRNS